MYSHIHHKRGYYLFDCKGAKVSCDGLALAVEKALLNLARAILRGQTGQLGDVEPKSSQEGYV